MTMMVGIKNKVTLWFLIVPDLTLIFFFHHHKPFNLLVN